MTSTKLPAELAKFVKADALERSAWAAVWAGLTPITADTIHTILPVNTGISFVISAGVVALLSQVKSFVARKVGKNPTSNGFVA